MSALLQNHEFWSSGSLRCVLIAQTIPESYTVQVLNHGSVVVYERCDTGEEAAALAERFWTLFVEH